MNIKLNTEGMFYLLKPSCAGWEHQISSYIQPYCWLCKFCLVFACMEKLPLQGKLKGGGGGEKGVCKPNNLQIFSFKTEPT